MERYANGNLLIDTFDSMQEFADNAVENVNYSGGWAEIIHKTTLDMVKNGWSNSYIPDAMRIAEQAVEAAYTLAEHANFTPTWEVAGAEVDVGRYVSGEPENMIDFPVKNVTSFGRTVTLVSSTDANCMTGADGFLARGMCSLALAMALNRLGYSVEIWADNYGYSSPYEQYQRIKVKGTGDSLDAEHLMYAFGHETVLRELAFGTFDGYPGVWKTYFSDCGRGGAKDERGDRIKELYPEGTIFVVGNVNGTSVEEMATYVIKEIQNLGLLDF